jgi:predicted transposase YdaD
MRESVIYQAIVREGVEQGELAMVLRQLRRRIGAVATELLEQIQALSQAQVEELGEALLDFSSAADLVAWLQAHPRP